VKTNVVISCPGDKIRLSKIDPDNAGRLTKEDACARVDELRKEIAELQEKLYAQHERSLLVIFQGIDTAGKDGAIEDLCYGMNPAGLELARFREPTPAELEHDFLWRAHQVAPARGMFGIWNRSHYEDVLVARVHKLVPKKIWKARFDQINCFEETLAENGTIILKFMLHISKDEQKRRLEARLEDPSKRWKFNVADLKERALWNDYQKAYEDAINCCSIRHAPWYIVPANHKWARDFAVIDTVFHRLKKMKPRYPKLRFNPAAIKIE
jgi:PPK2 family polyphosphate:nucleotide phosphotransferase